MKKYLFSAILMLSTVAIPIEASASKACPETNLTTLNGEVVKINRVGVFNACYHYLITTGDKKIKIPENAVHKAEIALILGYKMWIDTRYDDFSLINEH